MKRIIYLLLVASFLCAQEEYQDLMEMSLEDLLNMEVVTASGVKETALDAPATMLVITSDDIRQRGYTSLDEVVEDLPGFDVTVTNGTHYMTAYQRGYRTPWTQRTLLMINNKVDNNMWSHAAMISRQYPISNVKRIEVLYGPASAVYGPNAFLGIINVVTNDGSEIEKGTSVVNTNFHAGSFNTKAIDMAVNGNYGELHYSFATKVFRSDEADLSGKWEGLSNERFGSKATWGPLLNVEHYDKKLGTYSDPSDDYGIIGNITYGNFTFGMLWWDIKEAYGTFYSADYAQNNTMWNKRSRQFWGEYKKEFNDDLRVETLLKFRKSDIPNGIWAEAFPDWDDTKVNYEDSSYVSFTFWNSLNNSWEFKQSAFYAYTEDINLSIGLKYERKELTKAYDIPGYWDGTYSSVGASGSGVIHTRENNYDLPQFPTVDMPYDNLVFTEDFGGFVQAIINHNEFRFSLGVRYDENSVYGDVINPRISGIYKMNDKTALKLLWGTAFQEPGPIQLYGGWSGRAANPDLKPEDMSNLEAILMTQTDVGIKMNHEISAYYSKYNNVIKEEAENAGKRTIFGLEYKLRFSMENFIYGAPDIGGYFYTSFVDATSSIHYDFAQGKFVDGDAELGDMAPWKFHMGLNFPVSKQLNFNIRGQYITERTLYLRNALRGKGEKADAFFLANANIRYAMNDNVSFALKINNLLNNTDYKTPGGEQADGGNDFKDKTTGKLLRTKGFRNSLIPHPDRNFLFGISLNY